MRFRSLGTSSVTICYYSWWIFQLAMFDDRRVWKILALLGKWSWIPQVMVMLMCKTMLWRHWGRHRNGPNGSLKVYNPTRSHPQMCQHRVLLKILSPHFPESNLCLAGKVVIWIEDSHRFVGWKRKVFHPPRLATLRISVISSGWILLVKNGGFSKWGIAKTMAFNMFQH